MTTAFRKHIGMDPEIFAVKRKGARTVAHSAHTIDLEPYSSKDDWNSGSASAHMKKDGFAFEINTDPTYCRDWIIPSTAGLIRKFYDRQPTYALTAKPKMRLAKSSLINAPEDVMGYGCVPDRNAYTMQEKTPDARGYLSDARFTGGHLHFSLKDIKGSHEEMAAAATIISDIYLGVPLVAMLGEANDYGEADRRFYYGQAGSHRVTPYGFEYRVPSSAIIMTPYLLAWAFGQLRAMLGQGQYGMTPQFPFYSGQNTSSTDSPTKETIKAYVTALHKQYNFNTVQAIINNHDVSSARAFVSMHDIATQGRMYYNDFYDGMVRADRSGFQMESDLFDGWKLGSLKVKNHDYIGVESLYYNAKVQALYPEFVRFINTNLDPWDLGSLDYYDEDEDDYGDDPDYCDGCGNHYEDCECDY